MKKTLFILLALGSVAAAEEIIPTTNGFSWDTETQTTTFTYYVVGPESTATNSFVYEVSEEYDNDGTVDGKITGAVHVGSVEETKEYGVINLDPTINNAKRFDVGANGTLIFVGETGSNGSTTTTGGITAESFLTTTTGSGNLVLRTPDQDINADQLKSNALTVDLKEESQFTGNLIISPVPTDGNSLYQQSHVNLKLGKGADVSSFESVMIGSAKTAIYVEGEVGKTTDAAHIRNLTLLGSSDAYLNLNTDVNGEFVLGGVTKIEPYTYTGSGECDSALNVDFDVTTKLRIEELTGSAGMMTSLHFTNGYQKQNDASITTTDVVGSFNIESFDFRGTISLDSYVSGGTIEGRINLIRDDNQGIHQKLYDYQLQGYVAENATDVTQKVELDGQGTYVLSEGIAITPRRVTYTYNFATLADTWIGTVEVNKLTADIDFTKYGNENSTVHFRGYKGALEGGDSVSINTNLKLENVEGWYAYELTGTQEDTAQAQTYTGSISGDGDFVLNSEKALDITFTGDLSGWVEADETSEQTPVLLAADGAHKVTFSGNVDELNADVLTANDYSELQVSFARSGETEVNGIISHEAGGKMDLSVAQGTTVTFNDTVDVDTAAISGTTVVGSAEKITAGMVSVADRNADNNATLSGGTVVSANTVSGGKVAGAEISFGNAAASLTGVQLADTKVTGEAGTTVSLSDVTTDAVFYNNVVLSGQDVTYSAVDTTSVFDVTGGSTQALSGMTLDSISNATVRLQDVAEANLPTSGATINELTVTLTGFVMESIINDADNNTGTSLFGTTATYEITGQWREDLVLKNNLLSNLDLEGATITYTQTYNPDKQMDAYGNFLTITIENATYAIPEPTTATLSLLALAGLAARRRRR